MKNTFFLLLCLPACLWAGTRVSLKDLQSRGWDAYRGQSITITTPLIVCATLYDSLILAPERLYVPEEHAIGLADGDSTNYWRLVNYNNAMKIKLECRYPYNLNLGATITNLEACVIGERHLQTGKQPAFRNYKPKKRLPDMADYDMLICSANIQNFFTHVGGYATRRNTQGQHTLQCYKVASALEHFHADLYVVKVFYFTLPYIFVIFAIPRLSQSSMSPSTRRHCQLPPSVPGTLILALESSAKKS